MTKISFAEGDIFSSTIPSGVTFLGVVARVAKGGKILCAYFFDSRKVQYEIGGKIPALEAGLAVTALRFGDLRLMNKTWPLIGRMSPWIRENWPIPNFIRRDPLSNCASLITYGEVDLLSEVEVSKCSPEATGYQPAGLNGALAVEVTLAKLADVRNF